MPKVNKLKVSIIIPTYRRNAELKLLTSSIAKSSFPLKDLEVTIVDNASDYTIERILKNSGIPNLSVYHLPENLFSGGARQFGLEKASHRYVFFIDDDNTLDIECISSLVENLASNNKVVIAAPVMLYKSRPNIIWSAGGKVSQLGQVELLYSDQPLAILPNENIPDIDYFPNAFMIDSEQLQNITFEKLLPHNWNETDFCFEAKKYGSLVTVPDSKIYHNIDYRSKITRVSLDQAYDQAKSRIIFRKKHMNNFSLWIAFWGVVFPISSAYYMYAFIKQRNISTLKLVKNYLRGTVSGIRIKIET